MPPEFINSQVIDEWFSFHPPTGDQQERYDRLRQSAKQLASAIVLNCPPSADRSAALRLVREAAMTANASIALEMLQQPTSA